MTQLTIPDKLRNSNHYIHYIIEVIRRLRATPGQVWIGMSTRRPSLPSSARRPGPSTLKTTDLWWSSRALWALRNSWQRVKEERDHCFDQKEELRKSKMIQKAAWILPTITERWAGHEDKQGLLPTQIGAPGWWVSVLSLPTATHRPALQGGLPDAVQVLFGPKIDPTIWFFTPHLYNPPFSVSVGPDSMRS